MQHAMMDLELFAGDNHIEQYMIIDGEAYCYDFARLNPSGESEIRPNAAGKLETYCNLKKRIFRPPSLSRRDSI